MTERSLTVSRHAVRAYAWRRYARSELQVFEDVDWQVRRLAAAVGDREAGRLMLMYNELSKEIAEQVRCGLEQGHILDHKPKGFVLYGRRSAGLPDGQRFVWCGEDPQVGFVLKRHPDPEEGDVVMTALSRVGVRR